MPHYHLVPANPETTDLGATGKMIYNMIKENKPLLFQRLKQDGSLIKTIQGWEEEYKNEMLWLMDSGKNKSEAREIAWPEITARFGM